MIWIDTDGGVDDALAIAVASKLVKGRDLAFSTVFGNVSARQAAHNVRALLQLLDLDAPLFLGADRASDDFVVSATHIHGADGLGGAVGEVEIGARFPSLHRELLDFVKRRQIDEGGVHILGIGPATNIPLIVKSIGPDRICGITVMAGALFDRGNITEDAEFNLYSDPSALTNVLSLGVPVTIVPLDLCRKIVFRRDDVASLMAFGNAGQLLVDAHRFYMASYEKNDGIYGCFPHDTIALLSLLYPSRFDFWELSFDIDASDAHRGKMRFRPEGKYRARVCLGGELSWVRKLTRSWVLPAVELKTAGSGQINQSYVSK
jgi:inosine-uridine nucleoside N-ribohydrolase